MCNCRSHLVRRITGDTGGKRGCVGNSICLNALAYILNQGYMTCTQALYSSGIAIVEASTVCPSCSVSHELAQTAGIQGNQALNKMNETYT